VALATQRVTLGLMLPGAVWVGLGGLFGALGGVGVTWQGWPRPGKPAVMFGGGVYCAVLMVWVAWEVATSALEDAMAAAWMAGQLAAEPLGVLGLAGTTLFAVSIAGAAAVMGAWLRLREPGHASKVMVAGPLRWSES
jgi:hypothetical protein